MFETQNLRQDPRDLCALWDVRSPALGLGYQEGLSCGPGVAKATELGKSGTKYPSVAKLSPRQTALLPSLPAPPAPPPRSLCERMVGRTGLVNKGRMLWLLPFGGPYPLPLPPQRSIKEDSKVAWEGCLGSIPFSGGVAPWSASDLLPKNLKRTSGEEK